MESTVNKPSNTQLAAGKKAALNGVVTDTLISALLPTVLKVAFVGGVAYIVYRQFTNRFVELPENGNYPAANITLAQAKTRADAIANSIGWMSNDFDVVVNNLTGLNYNGFIRLYNAFGLQRGTVFAGKLNLIEWLRNQFDNEQIQELSLLTNGVFFRSSFTGNAIVLSKAIGVMSLPEKNSFIQLLTNATTNR